MKRNYKGLLNLDYIEVRNVPIVKNENRGEGVESQVLGQVERLAARAILGKKLPIRGLEIQFFRKVLAMSQKQLGLALGYSDVAILKWERAKLNRLDPVNEVAVRALMAEKFGVKIKGTFEALLGGDKTPRKLVVAYQSQEDELDKAS